SGGSDRERGYADRAPAVGQPLAGEGNGVGISGAETEASDETPRGHVPHAFRPTRADGSKREDQRGKRERPAAAYRIAEPASCPGADPEPNQSRAHRPAEAGAVGAEIIDHQRC